MQRKADLPEKRKMDQYLNAKHMVTAPFCHSYYHRESEGQPEDCNPLYPRTPKTRNLSRFAWK